jgi:uncharacterized RDD family membrane protein YckC
MSEVDKGFGQEVNSTNALVPTEGLHRYAGFWIRFLAVILDSIALLAFFLLLSFILGVSIMTPPIEMTVFQNIFGIVYYVVLTVYGGQTLGKMILGIQVIRVDLQPNQWGHIIIREFPGKIISSLILLIGYIMAAFDSQKRALHDRMASTVVVWK